MLIEDDESVEAIDNDDVEESDDDLDEDDIFLLLSMVGLEKRGRASYSRSLNESIYCQLELGLLSISYTVQNPHKI